jgi:hypothetical protein
MSTDWEYCIGLYRRLDLVRQGEILTLAVGRRFADNAK